jgi:ParB-like chromosome segregation protein Spo0J
MPVNGALKIEHLPTEQLRPFENNARRHPKKQIDKLAKAINDFGLLIPIVIDGQNTIIAGHARLEAAKLLGLAKIPERGANNG